MIDAHLTPELVPQSPEETTPLEATTNTAEIPAENWEAVMGILEKDGNRLFAQILRFTNGNYTVDILQGKIPQQFLDAVIACDVDGLSYKEHASQLGRDRTGIVSSRVARGRAAIQTYFRENPDVLIEFGGQRYLPSNKTE